MTNNQTSNKPDNQIKPERTNKKQIIKLRPIKQLELTPRTNLAQASKLWLARAGIRTTHGGRSRC